VLLVCTANQGRSAMADALLRALLASRHPDAEVTVGSAGLLDGGVAVTAPVADAVRPYGGDLGTHRSRRITTDVIEQADLVVCMAGEHARAVVELRADARARTFTLRELVALLEDSRPRQAGEPLSDFIARQSARRADEEAWSDPAVDIADPYGKPASAVAETAAEIHDLLRRLTERVWPVSP
jgi:protein-tyrosine phosphatase